jgi:hypothetical protein
VARSLLKQVTEAMCSLLLPRSATAPAITTMSAARNPPPKISVFLSHAKQDGTVPARRLRDYIYSQTQLAAFYDENDIAFGSSFASVIQKALDSQETAAFVACRSARYANRPWCRREFSLFRTPQKSPQSLGQPERWRIYPSLVVEAMEGREFSAGIPEFGNSPAIRWNNDDSDMEELIITTIIRDAMLAAYHAALGGTIPAIANQIVINWLPDPTTLLHIPAVRSGTQSAVFYPGRGLSGLELDTLDGFFPNVTFHCFEDALTTDANAPNGLTNPNAAAKTSDMKYRARSATNNVVAFSVSYERDNMLALGLGLEHLRELLVRLARPMLRQRIILAYGGNWKESEENFTFELLRLISAEQEDNSVAGADSNLQLGKLYNHSSWPNYLDITPSIEAQWINCCRIIRVTQEKAGLSESEIVKEGDQYDNARANFNKAVTSSSMRRLTMEETSIDIPDVPTPERVHPVSARILLGGKVERYSGFLPGIFEEALVTLQKGCPVFLLGGFGGAARSLADAFLAAENNRPSQLTLEWHKKRSASLANLLDGSAGFRLPSNLALTAPMLDSLFEFVKQGRGNLSGILNTGLNEDDTRELLETRDVANAVRLVRAGLQNKGILQPVSS